MDNINQYLIFDNAGESGLTLVEVIVAILILAASLTVLLISFSRGTHVAGTSRRELNAMHIAREEIERFRTMDYTNIGSYASTNLTNSFFVPLDGRKQCTVITNVNGYKEITLNISWKSTANSQTISQSYNTIICSTN
jgi:type II secretory pathway pseudopilin PulG